MRSWSMIIADSARARFFSIEWSDDPELDSSPKLSFARLVAERAASVPAAHCLLVADKRRLGLLRKALGGRIPAEKLTDLAARRSLRQ